MRGIEVEAPPRLFYSDSDTGLKALHSVSAVNNISVEPGNFVLDEALFDILGSEATRDPPAAPPRRRSSSPAKTQHLSTPDSEEPSFYTAWKDEQRKKFGDDWNPVLASPTAEPEHDHLADFEEWLATTDSIEFIG